MRRGIVGLSLLCLCGAVSADSGDGSEIKRYCEAYDAGEASFAAGYCMGYILGVIHGHMDGYIRNGSERGVGYKNAGKVVGACLPTVSHGQVVEVVYKWLRENPERQHMQASTLITRALREAFGAPPCN